MFIRTNADKSSQFSVIERSLHEDEQMCSQLQTDARNGEQQKQGLFESWIVVNEPFDFSINVGDQFDNLLDDVLMSLLSDFGRNLLAIDCMKRILESS